MKFMVNNLQVQGIESQGHILLLDLLFPQTYFENFPYFLSLNPRGPDMRPPKSSPWWHISCTQSIPKKIRKVITM
jgi:hypothetical protein